MTEPAQPPKEFLSRFSNSFLIKLQACSGASFATFLALHITNIFSANFGISWFTAVQTLFRKYYQNPAIEATMVFGSLAVHIATSLVLYIRRRQREKNPKAIKPVPTAQKINRIAGYLMSLVIFGHVFGFRVLGFLDPAHAADFSMLTFTLYAKPVMFTSYYFLLGSAGLYHLCYGLLKASDLLLGTKLTNPVTKSKWFLPIMMIGPALFASSIYAIRGGYFDVRDTREKMTMWAEHFEHVMGMAYQMKFDFSKVAVLLSKE